MLFATSNVFTPDEMLKELAKADSIDMYRRLKVIELSSLKKKVPELANLFGLCQATVRTYIHNFNKGGFDALRRDYSPGCPVSIPLTKEELIELLHQSPSQFELLGSGARNWTQGLMVRYLFHYHQVTVTFQAVSAFLKRHQLRLNRGKLKVTSPDPDYKVKRKRIETLKKSL